MLVQEITKNGLKFIKIKNESLTINLCNLGASIYSIYYKGVLMTQTPKNVEDFKKINLYHGKTIGRVANRIEYGNIIINDKTYQISVNEGLNTLHGGQDGLSCQFFNYYFTNDNEKVIVTFEYLSQDGESGFPGNLHLKVKYIIFENTLSIEYYADSDEDTLCNLTNHTYFCLGEDNINNLSMYLDSDKYIKTRRTDLIPIRIEKVPQYLDFSTMKAINKDINNINLLNAKTNGYDHHFCFKCKAKNTPQIKLSSTNYQLEISTNFSGVQIYTDNYEDGIEYLNSKDLKRRGVAIEPEDSHLDDRLLKKGTEYYRYIKYSFFRKHEKNK